MHNFKLFFLFVFVTLALDFRFLPEHRLRWNDSKGLWVMLSLKDMLSLAWLWLCDRSIILSITAQNSPRRSDVNDIDVKRKFCRVNSETITRTFLHCPKERTLIKKTLLILALKNKNKTPTTYIHRQGALFSLCTTSMVTERLVRAGPPCVAHSFVTLILNIFSSQCREPGSAGKRPEQRHTAVSWWVQILTRDYKSTYKSISTASKVMGHSNTDRVCE